MRYNKNVSSIIWCLLEIFSASFCTIIHIFTQGTKTLNPHNCILILRGAKLAFGISPCRPHTLLPSHVLAPLESRVRNEIQMISLMWVVELCLHLIFGINMTQSSCQAQVVGMDQKSLTNTDTHTLVPTARLQTLSSNRQGPAGSTSGRVWPHFCWVASFYILLWISQDTRLKEDTAFEMYADCGHFEWKH